MMTPTEKQEICFNYAIIFMLMKLGGRFDMPALEIQQQALTGTRLDFEEKADGGFILRLIVN